MLRLFHTPVSASLTDAVGGATGAAVLTFVLLFLPSFLFMKLLARSIGKKTRSSMLGPFDRVLGGGFGMLKGLLAVTLFFLLANLATDLTYGPDEPTAGVDAQFADLSLAQRQRARGGRLGRNAAQGHAEPELRTKSDPPPRHDGPQEAGVRARRPEADHHVCVRTDGLRARAYRQCPPGGGVRPAAPRAGARISRRRGDLRAQRHRRRRQDHRFGGGRGRRRVGHHRAVRAALPRGHGRARREPADDRSACDAGNRPDGRDDRAADRVRQRL